MNTEYHVLIETVTESPTTVIFDVLDKALEFYRIVTDSTNLYYASITLYEIDNDKIEHLIVLCYHIGRN